jgi:hypothetical protein
MHLYTVKLHFIYLNDIVAEVLDHFYYFAKSLVSLIYIHF